MDRPTHPGRAQKACSVDSFTRGFVRKAARRLIGKFGFKPQDREDIEHSLYLKLLAQLQRTKEPDHRWRAFVAIIASHQIANMIRDRRAEKRDYRRTCSIQTQLASSKSDSADIRDGDVPSRKALPESSELEQINLRIDVAECIASIPNPRHREFCARLQSDSISQVAKDMNLPRTTLNSWLQKVRAPFESRGLQKYL
jgi:RNA polymerase sigma-70 factor (ECF subfamily)